jgi:hypothetical protein
MDELLGYLRFNEQIGELLCQGHSVQRVMAYDADYRRLMSAGINSWGQALRWGDADFFLASKHLMGPGQQQPRPDKQQRQQVRTPQGQPVCLSFNGAKGCSRQQCKFAHVCRVCFEEHPASAHSAAKN